MNSLESSFAVEQGNNRLNQEVEGMCNCRDHHLLSSEVHFFSMAQVQVLRNFPSEENVQSVK